MVQYALYRLLLWLPTFVVKWPSRLSCSIRVPGTMHRQVGDVILVMFLLVQDM